MSKDKEQVVQRWIAKKRTALVISIIKRETSIQEAARKHGLRVAEIEGWQETGRRAGSCINEPRLLDLERVD